MAKKRATQKQANRTLLLNTGTGPRPTTLARALELLSAATTAGQWTGVISVAGQIVEQIPGVDDARLPLYRGLAALEDYTGLDHHCRNFLVRQPRDLLALEYLAHSLRQQGKEGEALPFLERAVQHDGTSARLANTLGTLYKELGRKDQARDSFARAIALKPGLGKGCWNRSDLVEDAEAEIALLEKQYSRLTATSRERPYFCFALYRHCENRGDHDKAFHYLAEGNRAKKALLNYSVDADLDNDRRILAFFRDHYAQLQERISSRQADRVSPQPVFIVGMPRSGTSLVEQILASHPAVDGAGEVPWLPNATRWTLARAGQTTSFPDVLASLTTAQFGAIGRDYLRQAEARASDRTFVTDKYLLNYRVLPLVALVLPRARIIHVVRDPMDTCFGCYRQLFNTGLGFCYDLDDLAATWNSYRDLMTCWDELLGDRIYHLQYESLVTDPGGEVSRLLDHCELADDGRCYRFWDTERAIRTVSNLQVRQPVTASGIGRWKGYAQHLKGLQDALGVDT